MTAKDDVNVERSKLVSDKILMSMIDKSVDNFTFQKAEQTVTFGSKSNIKSNIKVVLVDPQLIFYRLAIFGECMRDLPSLYRYEF